MIRTVTEIRGLITVLFFFIACPSLSADTLEVHPEGKITLKNGTAVKGKNLALTDSTVKIDKHGEHIYKLSKVSSAQVKNSWAKGGLKFGLVGGAIIAGASIRKAHAQDELEAVPHILSGVLFTASVGAVGYSIGSIFDHWETIYPRTPVSPDSHSE